MYPAALDAGIATQEFWNLTLLEIYDRVESYRRTTELKRKEKIDQDFVLASAIATRVIWFFEDPKDRTQDQILEPYDAYPDLFKKEEEKVQANKQKLEIEKHIAAMRAFDAAYQRKKRQEDGNRP